jgi:hypothetical protein
MGFDFVGLMEGAPLDWSEFANRFCTGVLGRTPQLPSCGNRVTTDLKASGAANWWWPLEKVAIIVRVDLLYNLY